MHRRPPRPRGFTLPEALAALAVLAILLAMALPAMRALLVRHRTLATVNELVASAQLARSLAVTRRSTAVLCPSQEGRRCSGQIDWTQGWIVFDAPDAKGQPTASSRIAQHVARGDAPATRILASAGRRALRYNALGFSGGSNLTLRICEGDRLRARVIVNNTGRPRTEMRDGTAPCEG